MSSWAPVSFLRRPTKQMVQSSTCNQAKCTVLSQLQTTRNVFFSHNMSSDCGFAGKKISINFQAMGICKEVIYKKKKRERGESSKQVQNGHFSPLNTCSPQVFHLWVKSKGSCSQPMCALFKAMLALKSGSNQTQSWSSTLSQRTIQTTLYTQANNI